VRRTAQRKTIRTIGLARSDLRDQKSAAGGAARIIGAAA
jgi:hypothetical protein